MGHFVNIVQFLRFVHVLFMNFSKERFIFKMSFAHVREW